MYCTAAASSLAVGQCRDSATVANTVPQWQPQTGPTQSWALESAHVEFDSAAIGAPGMQDSLDGALSKLPVRGDDITEDLTDHHDAQAGPPAGDRAYMSIVLLGTISINQNSSAHLLWEFPCLHMEHFVMSRS